MTVRTIRLALLALALALPLAAGRGQPPAGNQPAEIKALRNIGAGTCTRCHRAPLPEDKEQKVTDFLRLDEASTFRDFDLHAKAFQVLSEPLGKQMGAILGWEDVSKRVECLACHAVNLSQELTPGVPRPGRTPEVFHTADGVSCEACHGIADKWFRDHIDKAWRSVTPEKKLADFGERDMRDPTARAERCAACHVGNAAEGKFVTHAMYAAGHPPLPPLEVMTFSRDQPMHYKYARDLRYFETLDAETSWKLFHYRKGESQPARQVAVGAVVTFREALKALAHSADTTKAGGMLDFAHFDCAACHHELETPSWRQARGYATTPGRPLPFTGPTALLRAVLRHGAEADAALKQLGGEFDGKHATLLKAFGARPFGDPAAVGQAAHDLAAWCDAVGKGLEAVRYDDAQTARLRRIVAEAARAGAGLGYDDSQQLLWAFAVLNIECTGTRPEVVAALQELGGPDKPFLLRLAEPNQPRPLIANGLRARLRHVAAYRPEPFQQAFGRILGLLPPQ